MCANFQIQKCPHEKIKIHAGINQIGFVTVKGEHLFFLKAPLL